MVECKAVTDRIVVTVQTGYLLGVCAGQEAGISGADTGGGLLRGGMERVLLGFFLLCDLWQYLWNLRQPFHYHHRAAVDVFLHVYHHDRRLSEPVFPAGEQGAS